MKLRFLSLAVLSSIAVGTHADATQDLQDQAHINALQNQIASLQNQIQNLNTSPTSSHSLSNMVMLDTEKPLGAMFYTSQPLLIMQAKPTLNAPIVLGGSLQADAQHWGGTFSTVAANGVTYKNGSDVDLTGANLFTMANFNDWVTGFISFSSNVGGSINSGSLIDRAYLMVGNLQQNPLFLTVGEGYLPFGAFEGNGSYANSLNTDAFRISRTNQISLNYYKDGLSTSLTAFASQATSTDLDDFVYNIRYDSTMGSVNYGLGAGYIHDIRGTNSGIGAAYPDGATAAPPDPTTDNINGSRNAAFNFNGSIAYDAYALKAQYDTTQRGAIDTAGQYVGRMSAWNVTASYATTVLDTPAFFHIGYSGTRNMATIPFPLIGMIPQSVQTAGSGTNNNGMKSQWQLGMSNEIIKNVYIGPEFNYQYLYNKQNTWAMTYDVVAYF